MQKQLQAKMRGGFATSFTLDFLNLSEDYHQYILDQLTLRIKNFQVLFVAIEIVTKYYENNT